MYKPNTLKDIALELGLSVSTVSRALSDNYQISEYTKRKVKERANKMNYVPNPFAVSLKVSRSFSIGVVIPSIRNTFYAQAINGIESVAYSKGYHVVICQSHHSAVREAESIGHLKEKKVDGVLMALAAGSHNLSHIKQYTDGGDPLVFFNCIADLSMAECVVADNKKIAAEAAEEFISQGCRKVYIIASVAHAKIVQDRVSGFRDAWIASRLDANDINTHYCGTGEQMLDSLAVILADAQKESRLPDTVFGLCEETTLAILQIVNKLSLTNAVKVAGFNNSEISPFINPPPTLFRQPAFQIGKTAAEKLIYAIENPDKKYSLCKKTIIASEKTTINN
ncbi:hypothetical protein BCY91_03160 [Pelobium manganitolerans]|uniref:HTH lacI-type domain-containing protein n=1 Tax=Pelobium manganitolerans TaxID=1842495 RepID=A0A419S748_9SPHI|nr:LacI family DNA-binding transcriptional regulator [Pelobium manganitolerans]RKD17154.1 hypothetical protein BCY91_03160 [Pelobium manganitolerans]